MFNCLLFCLFYDLALSNEFCISQAVLVHHFFTEDNA
nr:MAG TPA: hypothetical protein [Bacteriophage sp.]